MEVKINKEIRDYAETVFFGLSLRQFIFSVCACMVAIGIYFLLKPYFAISELSWMCILGAFPFATLGFVTYNGMNSEEIITAWIRSEIQMPRHLCFNSENYYDELLNSVFQKIRKDNFNKGGIEEKGAEIN
jgi:hypothetical protein